MKQILIHPLKEEIHAEISLPGCIGYTIRALNIAAMTKGNVKILNPLKSDDTYKMFHALNDLGIQTEEGNDYFMVKGDISDVVNKEYMIDIGLSGRSARTILSLLCIVKGTKILTCDAGFKKRPVGGLVDGLRQLGAEITYLEKSGYLPLKITSDLLSPGTVSMEGETSSQYLSALMMIAPIIGDIEITVKGPQSSKPYIDMTIGIMSDFGIKVINNNYNQYKINALQTYMKPGVYYVEPEATSASYFFAIAAITKSIIKILGLNPASLQGDLGFVDILEKMGCSIKKNFKENWIEVEGTNMLKGVNVDMNNTPDLVPTLSVIAAFAKGKTKITNIAHAKVKETDRIESPKFELEKMGIKVVSTNNSLTVFGGIPHGENIQTYNDHRMAMAFAVAGVKIPGIVIRNPEVVNKSFPTFWDKMEEIGIRLERSEL